MIMDRWNSSDKIKESENIVINDPISGDKIPITDEEQKIILGVAKILMDRSLKYYQVHEGNLTKEGKSIPSEKHIAEHYIKTAWLIYEAAKKLSSTPGGKGYGSHSLQTWIAIMVGQEAENLLINKEMTEEDKAIWCSYLNWYKVD
jgi:hypothetical protein